MALPKVLAFDVFGAVVDLGSSMTRDAAGFLATIGRADLDAADFADVWRFRYIDVMRDYRTSGRPFVTLDVLHREMLEQTLCAHGIDPADLDAVLIDVWNRSWHRLDPWPDAVAGLARLKTRFPVVTLTNANIALMLAMSRRAKLPWDALLGAEVTRAYKPDPQAYLGTAAALGLPPDHLCLIATHHSDLAAARACGLTTAYVDRPLEYGGRGTGCRRRTELGLVGRQPDRVGGSARLLT